jgi:plastocyanin
MLLACIATLGRGRTPPAPAPTAAPAAAPTAAQPTDAIVTNLKVTAQDTLKFEPATLSAPANGAITVTFKNAGAQQHNWVLTSTADADRIATEGAAKGGDATGITGVIEDSEPVAGGRSKYIGFTIPTAGTYIYLCTIPGHYQAGMKGILTVN